MLHFKSVDSATLDLLNQLMRLPALFETRLVGGTALALQTGFRKSVDIDLFGTINNKIDELPEQLTTLGEVSLVKETINIHIYMINGIKVDIVEYPYERISECKEVDGIRLAGKEDIAAMKLSAITGRGSKKDFFDLYFLLKEFKLEQMLRFYLQKFPQGTLFLVLRSLTYFDDAEKNVDPILFKPLSWKEVKKRIKTEVEEYLSVNQ